ncbi:MAG: Veg family protein [Defluviitaleaceae bacterium]|nr:Veg family protein [Defluviitaleaceae bacterium]
MLKLCNGDGLRRNAEKWGVVMYARNDVTSVRNSIAQHVGQRVTLETNKGRQKSMVSSGTIQSAYPAIFTILLDDIGQGSGRTVSYSYTDVLTKSVELTVFSS